MTFQTTGPARKCKAATRPRAVLDIIQHQADMFKSRSNGLMKWINSTVHVLYTISATLGEGAGMVRSDSRCPEVHCENVVQALPSAKVVFSRIGLLLAVRSSVPLSLPF
jgi:hypothetical protein